MSLFSGEFPTLRPFQVKTHEAIRQAAREGHKRILVCAPTGAGKCLGIDTPVIMADGTSKKVQDVEVGDRLMGPDGKGRTVLSRTWGKDDLYTITPTKGDPYTVNSVHLLSLVRTPGSDGLRLSSGRHIHKDEEGPFFVEAQDFFQSNDTVKHCLKGWRPGPVDFDCAQDNHPIPPYILGIWLGDGTSKKPELSKPDGAVTGAWVAYAHSIGCDVSRNQEEGKCPLWRIKLARGEKNPFTNLLEGLGVLGNKHIPESYIMCSMDARLELLAGLLDTDGSCSHGGFDFIQKERSISESVVFLCRSLGLAAYMTESWKGIDSRDFDGQYWRVSISGDCSIIPCRDAKKKAQARLQKKNHLVTGLKIERAGYGLYFGFEIDGDRQFLLGDWQVTHNTIQALNTIRETLGKGNRAMFLADRKTLISQTSNVARDLGLGHHGIIQANNPMMDLTRPFQIASCQTLMRRGWPVSDVLIIDEAHTLYRTWREYITSDECKSFVIGLTATPFTKGLGKYFTKLINAATMAELTESGTLVPMRIFSCRKPDMSGAECKPSGEWSDDAASKAEMAIIGDVLTEWQKFANDRKTIVFGPTIDYCRELAKRFNDAGVRAEVFCADTPDLERATITQDFEYGSVRVLISVDALAKGFDQKDVGCVCDCRPLRKSLSTAIQMWGRGLRSCPEKGKEDCVLRGTKIITDKGEKNIEEISLDDKIWDGESFVHHKGAICRGTKHVIHYAGLIATPEHRVKTEEGWRSFGDCAAQQIRIVSTGSCGTPVRECEGHFRGDEVDRPQVETANALPLQMPNMWQRILDWLWGSSGREIQELPPMQPAGSFPQVALREGEWNGPAMPEPEEPPIRGLRRAWDRIQIWFGFRRVPLDSGQSRAPEGMSIGSNQQRWALRTWKSALVDFASKRFSHQKEGHRPPVPSISGRTSRSALCRLNPFSSSRARAHIRSDRGAMGKAILQTEGEVWDILDCGPRHCFTANGLLVHNCILLDFSGNIIRFWDDFERVFHEGVDRLDDGEKLDKAIREDKDEEPKACPKCGHKPFGRKCVRCGHEAERMALVEERPGEMQEIRIGKKVLATGKADLWAQVATYAKSHSSPEKQQGRAAHLYKDITGTWPPREWKVATTPDVAPTAATLGKIRSLYIAFSHRRAA